MSSDEERHHPLGMQHHLDGLWSEVRGYSPATLGEDATNSEIIDSLHGTAKNQITTSEISQKNLLKDGFALRLRNLRFNCFLNTALNSVFSNEIMIDGILDPSNEISSVFRILSGHSNVDGNM